MRATWANLLEHPPTEVEMIVPEPGNCFHGLKDDYPYPLARWHYHPTAHSSS